MPRMHSCLALLMDACFRFLIPQDWRGARASMQLVGHYGRAGDLKTEYECENRRSWWRLGMRALDEEKFASALSSIATRAVETSAQSNLFFFRNFAMQNSEEIRVARYLWYCSSQTECESRIECLCILRAQGSFIFCLSHTLVLRHGFAQHLAGAELYMPPSGMGGWSPWAGILSLAPHTRARSPPAKIMTGLLWSAIFLERGFQHALHITAGKTQMGVVTKLPRALSAAAGGPRFFHVYWSTSLKRHLQS